MAYRLRCGMTTIKYLLFFFNFLFSLCGLAILVVGVLALTHGTNAIGGSLKYACIFTIVVGAAIFVVAFLGCCGAVQESHCMLIMFAIALMVLIVGEVIIGVVLFVVKGSGEKVASSLFDKAIEGNAEAKNTVDSVQELLHCCGKTDPSFWIIKPASCCIDKSKPCIVNNFYADGCLKKVEQIGNTYGIALGIVALVVALVELLGVWFSLALAAEVRSLER